MQITVHFEAQVRRAAGVAGMAIPVDAPCSAAEIVEHVGRAAAEPLRRVLLDDSGRVRPTVMVFCDDEHVPLTTTRRFDGATVVTLTSPISGG
jgi:hypothetical protein